MGGKVKGLPIWAQISLPIATAILGGVIVWLLNIPTTTFQKRIQKASNDYQRAQLIMEIIDKSDSKNFPLLDSLIGTIEDAEIKEAMTWIVETRKELPLQVKQDVEMNNQPAITEHTATGLTDSTDHKEGIKPDDTTCAIIYLRGDPIADRDARATRDFLASKRPGNLKYYPLIDTDATWFLDKRLFVKGSTDIQLYYNCDDSVHRDLAKRVYYRLSEGLSGNKYGIDKYTGVYEVIDSSQKGHGVLKDYQFNSVAEWKLAGINTGLQSYAVSVIIAPYSLDTNPQKYYEEP